MSQERSERDEHDFSTFDRPLIVNGPEERAARERSEQQRREDSQREIEDENRRRITELQAQQTKAEISQAASSKKIVWLTLALFLATIVSAGVSALQFIAANESAQAAKSAADTAAQALSDTRAQAKRADAEQEEASRIAKERFNTTVEQGRQTLQAAIELGRSEQRAWVGPEHVLGPLFSEGDVRVYLKPGASPQFGIVIRNTGKTPAKNVRHRISGFSQSSNAPFIPSYVASPKWMISSTSVLHGDSTQTIQTGAANAPDDEFVSSIKSGEKALYVFGEILYSDVFGRSHTTTFCYYLKDTIETLRSCSTYNDAN